MHVDPGREAGQRPVGERRPARPLRRSRRRTPRGGTPRAGAASRTPARDSIVPGSGDGRPATPNSVPGRCTVGPSTVRPAARCDAELTVSDWRSSFGCRPRDVLRRFRAREVSPVEYLSALIASDRDRRRRDQRVRRHVLRRGARPGAGRRGDLCVRPDRRDRSRAYRSRSRTRPRSPASARRTARCSAQTAIGPRRPDRRPRARRGRDRPRAHAHAGVLDRLLDALAALGRDAQPVEPGVRRRRLERRLRGGARRRNDAARDRLGHRRLGPRAGVVLRRRRLYRAVRPVPRRAAVQPRSLVQRGTARTDRRGLRALADVSRAAIRRPREPGRDDRHRRAVRRRPRAPARRQLRPRRLAGDGGGRAGCAASSTHYAPPGRSSRRSISSSSASSCASPATPTTRSSSPATCARAVGDRVDDVNPYTRSWLASMESPPDPLDGLAAEAEVMPRVGAVLERFDALLCPVSAIPAFAAGVDHTVEPFVLDGVELDTFHDVCPAEIFNITSRCPVLSVPAGRGRQRADRRRDRRTAVRRRDRLRHRSGDRASAAVAARRGARPVSSAAIPTIPISWYVDREVLTRENALVLAPGWSYVGDAAGVSEPGTFMTARLGNVPIVVTRDRDGELRALANICRHRGAVVAEGCGKRATLQCPYHGWTYRLDGALHRAPGMEAPEGTRLPRLSVETVGPLLRVRRSRRRAAHTAALPVPGARPGHCEDRRLGSGAPKANRARRRCQLESGRGKLHRVLSLPARSRDDTAGIRRGRLPRRATRETPDPTTRRRPVLLRLPLSEYARVGLRRRRRDRREGALSPRGRGNLGRARLLVRAPRARGGIRRVDRLVRVGNRRGRAPLRVGAAQGLHRARSTGACSTRCARQAWRTSTGCCARTSASVRPTGRRLSRRRPLPTLLAGAVSSVGRAGDF